MTDLTDRQIVEKYAEKPWLWAELRRRLKLRAAFRQVRQAVWDGEYDR